MSEEIARQAAEEIMRELWGDHFKPDLIRSDKLNMDAAAAIIARVLRQEREACARVAERFETEFDLPDGVSKGRGETARAIAAAITTNGEVEHE